MYHKVFRHKMTKAILSKKVCFHHQDILALKMNR